jgi:hypothetical protein
MDLSRPLTESIQRDRERAIERSPLARAAACYRACCTPDLFDRIARRLGRNDCAEGAR